MKKIFTLLSVAALALSASAVEISLSTTDGTLLPDGNILFNQSDPDEEEVWITGHLAIASDEAVDATVTATLTSGFEAYGICFATCQLVQVGKSVSTSATIKPGSPLALSVEPVMVSEPWMPSVVRKYVVDVKVVAGANTLKSFSVIVTNDPEAALAVPVADKEGISVSGRTVSWNQASAPGLFTVYSITGRMVERINLDSTAGSVSIALPAGLYIWTAANRSGKLYIRD